MNLHLVESIHLALSAFALRTLCKHSHCSDLQRMSKTVRTARAESEYLARNGNKWEAAVNLWPVCYRRVSLTIWLPCLFVNIRKLWFTICYLRSAQLKMFTHCFIIYSWLQHLKVFTNVYWGHFYFHPVIRPGLTLFKWWLCDSSFALLPDLCCCSPRYVRVQRAMKPPEWCHAMYAVLTSCAPRSWHLQVGDWRGGKSHQFLHLITSLDH